MKGSENDVFCIFCFVKRKLKKSKEWKRKENDKREEKFWQVLNIDDNVNRCEIKWPWFCGF